MGTQVGNRLLLFRDAAMLTVSIFVKPWNHTSQLNFFQLGSSIFLLLLLLSVLYYLSSRSLETVPLDFQASTRLRPELLATTLTDTTTQPFCRLSRPAHHNLPCSQMACVNQKAVADGRVSRFPYYNLTTGERIAAARHPRPETARLRVTRQRSRSLLATHLNIEIRKRRKKQRKVLVEVSCFGRKCSPAWH